MCVHCTHMQETCPVYLPVYICVYTGTCTQTNKQKERQRTDVDKGTNE